MLKKIGLSLCVILGLTYQISRLVATLQSDLPNLEPHMQVVEFSRLPAWQKADLRRSFAVFQRSCHVLLRQDPQDSVGSRHIEMHVKDWLPACQAANRIAQPTAKKVHNFFEAWFQPVLFVEKNQPMRGVFTGYYMPLLEGRLQKMPGFTVPLYGAPVDTIKANLGLFKADLKHRHIVGRLENRTLLPYYTRVAINHGALIGHAPVIAWVRSQMDRLVLEIEGSGMVQVSPTKRIAVGYAGENGATYTSIPSIFIKQGLMKKDEASMKHIHEYFDTHPNQMDKIVNQNQSFVFFRNLKSDEAIGAEGVPLTPGYTLAVDRKWIPLGVPLWLNTLRQEANSNKIEPFNRLMVAQDTGGGINGPVRGDVFFGAGERASRRAEHMQHPGQYWLLLPRTVIVDPALEFFK